MAKQEFKLGKWEETALYFMRARADGEQIGLNDFARNLGSQELRHLKLFLGHQYV